MKYARAVKGLFCGLVVAGLGALNAAQAGAETVFVTGGQTSVLLDTDTLSSAAGLNLSSVSTDVIVPGELGPSSVAFGINARNAAPPALQTTFAYDPDNFLGTFSGSIEHTGVVLFNADTIEIGNFSIGFDASRAGGDASGFFVESTAGISAILFDVANPSELSPGASSLVIAADLLVSSEFATFLLDQGLANTNLTGADVGDARVNAIAAVPTPTAATIGLAGVTALLFRRRRSQQ